MSTAAMIGLIYIIGMMFTACLLSFLAMASRTLYEKMDDMDRGYFVATGAILWPIALPAQIGKVLGRAFEGRLP